MKALPADQRTGKNGMAPSAAPAEKRATSRGVARATSNGTSSNGISFTLTAAPHEDPCPEVPPALTGHAGGEHECPDERIGVAVVAADQDRIEAEREDHECPQSQPRVAGALLPHGEDQHL